MASFLEKLKKGMGAEIEAEEEPASAGGGTKSASGETQSAEATAGKQEKPVKKQRARKKLEIKTELIEMEERKEEKPSFAAPSPKLWSVGDKASEGKDKWFEQEGQLAVDVYETDGELVIQTAIAGVKPEDLDISIENDRVLIRGQRAEATKEKGKNYFYQECYWGQFSREIILPGETDPGRAEASMKQGVLTIRLPKIEREKKRKIEVKS